METSGKQVDRAHLKMKPVQRKQSHKGGERQIPEELTEGLDPAMPEADKPLLFSQILQSIFGLAPVHVSEKVVTLQLKPHD